MPTLVNCKPLALRVQKRNACLGWFSLTRRLSVKRIGNACAMIADTSSCAHPTLSQRRRKEEKAWEGKRNLKPAIKESSLQAKERQDLELAMGAGRRGKVVCLVKCTVSPLRSCS